MDVKPPKGKDAPIDPSKYSKWDEKKDEENVDEEDVDEEDGSGEGADGEEDIEDVDPGTKDPDAIKRPSGTRTTLKLGLMTAPVNSKIKRADPKKIPAYDNFKTYAAGDMVTYNGETYKMTGTIGAAGYAPPGYPNNWIKISQADLQTIQAQEEPEPTNMYGKSKSSKINPFPDLPEMPRNKIKGPRYNLADLTEPKPTYDSSISSNSDYPNIYGPEGIYGNPGADDDGEPGPFGHSGHKKKHKKKMIPPMFGGLDDTPQDYDFIPASEFPKGPEQPMPFTNDFSKIMH